MGMMIKIECMSLLTISNKTKQNNLGQKSQNIIKCDVLCENSTKHHTNTWNDIAISYFDPNLMPEH